MTPPEPCPSCGGTHVQVSISRRRSYGHYRRLVCCACGHTWTHREQLPGRSKPIPPPRQQCPECGSMDTAVIESRVMDYGRRQRVECRGCRHRWSNVIGGSIKARPQKRRDAGSLTEDEIRLILTSRRSRRELARELRVSHVTVGAVRLGELHAQVLPELPRRTAKPPQRSCTSSRFWDPEAAHPCMEGWPDPETDGPGYANECDDYSARV